MYQIELELCGNIKGAKLSLADAFTDINKNDIIFPNFNDNSNIVFMPSTTLFGNDTRNNNDSDNDGIPDDWELNGYTYKNNELIKWTDNLNNSFSKYVSNPYKQKTSNDPYTDMQKVIGQMPVSTKFEARDPMVPAIPIISVGMEKLLVSKNQNITEGNANTIATEASRSDTSSNTTSISQGAGLSEKGFYVGVSKDYSTTKSVTTSVTNTQSKSWSESIGINTSESAFLNANIRYYNTGTAPIYELRPTTNFVLQNSKSSIATIKSGPNQIGNSLAPGKTYPGKGLAPISLDFANEAGNSKITVDFTTLNDLQNSKDSINLETTQVTGQYGVVDSNGNFSTSTSNAWAPLITEIEESSANIIIRTPDSISERFIATKNTRDKNDKTPVLTIRDSLKKAFDIEERNGILYYFDESSRKEYTLSKENITIIFDQFTSEKINSSLANSPDKSFFDLPIERRMKMSILFPEFEDKMTPSLWTGYYYVYPDNSMYVNGYDGLLTLEKKLTIEQATDYKISFSLKPGKHQFTLRLKDNKTGKVAEKNFEFRVPDGGFKEYDFILPSSSVNGNDVTFSLSNTCEFWMFIKDFKITKLKKS